MTTSTITFPALCERHAALLFDAYGVLVDAAGALPGAREAIGALRERGTPFLVVTNDASRSPERAAGRLTSLGIPVEPSQILSSGMMIAPALREMMISEPRVVVLGTADSANYAREAGALVVPPSVDEPADAVVIADEGGFDTMELMDETLSMIVAAVQGGHTPRLLLANPDLIYPAGARRFGFTAGSLALMLEHALHLVLGDTAPTFEALGKPSSRIFREAIARVGTADAVMIGDQLHTDIAGAASVGMASALLLGGVSHHRATVPSDAETSRFGEWTPTYVLGSL